MPDFDIQDGQRVPMNRVADVYAINDEARESLIEGINLVANIVKGTLGPNGRPVMLAHGRQHMVTKDGVTVARLTSFRDPKNNAAATLVKEVCEEAVDAVGDGTTTALTLAQAIVNLGIAYMKAFKLNPIRVKEGIDITVDNVIKYLESLSKPIYDGTKIDFEELLHVAIVSCNGDFELGKLIAEAVHNVGVHGFIKNIQGKNAETFVTLEKGIQYPMGLKDHMYCFDEGGVATTFEDPLVLVANMDLQASYSLKAILEHCAEVRRPLVIVANKVVEEAEAYIKANRQAVKVAVANPPHFGDYRDDVMADIAILCDATVVKTALSNEMIKPSVLGACKRFFGEEWKTSFTAHDIVTTSANYKDRVRHLAMLMETHKDEEDFEAMQKRHSQLTSGCATITVGGRTPIAIKEKMARVEDAYLACKAALRGGILPGGGSAFLHVSMNYTEYCINNNLQHFNSSVHVRSLEDTDENISHETFGESIILNALLEPLKQILINSGFHGDDRLVDQVKLMEIVDFSDEFGKGYNARTGELVHLIKDGVIDPTDVGTTAIDKASSISSLILTIGGLLIKDSY